MDTSDVQDPSLDHVVLFQTPGAGTSAKPGTTVTITVGIYTPGAAADHDDGGHHPHDDHVRRRPTTTDTTRPTPHGP